MSAPTDLLDEVLGIMPGSSGGGALSKGSVVLLEDCVETSVSFVLHHLVKRALSLDGGGIVLFIALVQSFPHYERIFRKLGCNLSTHRDRKRFHFFDLLQMEFPAATQENGMEHTLVGLYSKIQRVVETSFSNDHHRGHITIFIDDLSILEIAVRGSMDRVLNFLHYCAILTSEKNCSLVILKHDDIYSDIEAGRLISHLVYLANFIIKAEPLITGIAADVHGQLTVLNKGALNSGHYSTAKACNFHFQVKENGAQLFFPGSRTS